MLLTCSIFVALVCIILVPRETDPKSGRQRVQPIAVAAVVFAFGCTVNASRFAYEGGTRATVGGLFVPIYNFILPFLVRKHTAAVLENAGIVVNLFGVSGEEWRKLVERRSQSYVLTMREQFNEYLNSADFRTLCEKLAPGTGRAGAKQLKSVFLLVGVHRGNVIQAAHRKDFAAVRGDRSGQGAGRRQPPSTPRDPYLHPPRPRAD
jgi:hypothetical protein